MGFGDVKTLSVSDIKSLNQVEVAELYNALKHDSALFARMIMGHIVKKVPEFHKNIYTTLDEMQRRKYNYAAFVCSRGLAKTTISKTLRGTHDVCFAHEALTMFLSETTDQSSLDLIGIQDEIENNEYINLLFGNLKGNVWNQERSEFANGTYIVCKGAQSRIRGYKWKNVRPTKFVLDDFESEHNTQSIKQRDDISRWINAQVLPAGTQESIYQFFGTIVHPESWLAKSKDLSFFKPPKGRSFNYPIEKKGKPIWVERYPMSWIKAKKEWYIEQGKHDLFLQEYYNIPAKSTQVVFDVNNIKKMDGFEFNHSRGITFLDDGTHKIPLYVFMGVDPASSLKDSACDTSIVTIGITPTKKVVLLDIYYDKIRTGDQVRKVFEIARKYRPKMVTVETNGYQLALVDWLREKISEGWQPTFPIGEYTATMNKDNKFIQGIEPLVNFGDCYYLPETKGIQTLFKQAQSFSEDDRREKIDTLDAWYLALENRFAPQKFDVDEAIMRAKNKKYNKRKLSWKAL